MEKVIDATNKPLGRLASEIAVLLQGKNSPAFAPHRIGDITVIVKNITSLKVTGRKEEQKIYRRHTGYPGGLKEKTFASEFSKHPERVLRQAVFGMLPANRLRAARLKNLKFE